MSCAKTDVRVFGLLIVSLIVADGFGQQLPAFGCASLELSRAEIAVDVEVGGQAAIEARELGGQAADSAELLTLDATGSCLRISRSTLARPNSKLIVHLRLSDEQQLRVEGEELRLRVAAPQPSNGAKERLLSRWTLAVEARASNLELRGAMKARVTLADSVLEVTGLSGPLTVSARRSELGVADQQGALEVQLVEGGAVIERGRGSSRISVRRGRLAVTGRRGGLTLSAWQGSTVIAEQRTERNAGQVRATVDEGQIDVRKTELPLELKLKRGARAELADLAAPLRLRAGGGSRIVARRIGEATLNLHDGDFEVEHSGRLAIKATDSTVRGRRVNGLDARLASTRMEIKIEPHPFEEGPQGNATIVTYPQLKLENRSVALLEVPRPCELRIAPEVEISDEQVDSGPCLNKREKVPPGGRRAVAYRSDGKPFNGDVLRILATLDASSTLQLR